MTQESEMAVQIAEQIEAEWKAGKHGPQPSAFRIARVAAERALKAKTTEGEQAEPAAGNESAADVAAKIIGNRVCKVIEHTDIPNPWTEVTFCEEALKIGITQAIQFQTKALAAENLELRAEIGRFRKTMIEIASWGCESDYYDICREHESDIAAFCYPCKANELLPPNTQPTPTGAGERFLRLAAAGLTADRVYKAFTHIASVLNRPGPIDSEAVAHAEKEYQSALFDLWDGWAIDCENGPTPEDIKILEGYTADLP